MYPRNIIGIVAVLIAFLAGLVFWWMRSSAVYQPAVLHAGESAHDAVDQKKELAYRIPLAKDHLFGISFAASATSVALDLKQPDGQSLWKIPCWHYRHKHNINEITAQSGDYLLSVSGCDEREAGSFELSISASPVSQNDRRRVAAERLSMEADILISEYRQASRLEAKQKYQEALQIYIAAQDKIEQSRILTKLGEVSLELGQTSAASEYFHRALDIPETEKSPHRWQILTGMAASSLRVGNAEKARSYALQALDIGRASHDPVVQAEALLALGIILYEMSDYAGAIDNIKQSLILWQQLDNPRGNAQALLYLAYCHSDLSEISTVSSELSEALRLFKKIGNRKGHACSLVALGHLYTRTADKQGALDIYNQARELLEDSGDLLIQGQLFSGIAYIYSELGDQERALEYYRTALLKYRSSDQRIAESYLLGLIGEIYYRLGDYANALRTLEESLSFVQKIENQRHEAYLLRDMAIVHEATGEISEAMEYLNRALELNRKVVDRRQEAYTLMSIGHIHESRKDIMRALNFYRQALDLNRSTADRFGEIANLYRISYCHLRLNNLPQALSNIEQSVSIIEELRGNVASYGLRTSYFGSIHQHYALYIELLMHMHRTDLGSGMDLAAFEVSERARARTLLENIAGAGLPKVDNVDPKLLERERILGATLDAKLEEYTELLSQQTDVASIETLRNEIARLTGEYEEVQGQMRLKNPRYDTLVKPEPLKLAQIQKELLDANSLLLEYALGEENSYLWAITRDGFSSFVLPKRSEISKRVRRLRELITARWDLVGEEDFQLRVGAAEAEYSRAAAELSQILLGPVKDQMGSRRLVFVADSVLQYLPFGALPTPYTAQTSSPQPLLLEHEIVNLPSASTLAAIRREASLRDKPDRILAIFADPVFYADDIRVKKEAKNISSSEKVFAYAAENPGAIVELTEPISRSRAPDSGSYLPRLLYSRKEAENILAFVDEDSRMAALGFQATRSAAMSSELKRYRFVHFATHTILNDDYPDLSSLVLSLVDERGNHQNGHLRLRDVYNLSLSAELVVLSACDTALGTEIQGEGLISMVRGFMYSGAPRVLASLWKVDDQATAELMKEFYRQMLEHQKTPAYALQQAQIFQLQKKSRQAPYYWAGFQLQGDWK